MEFRYAFFRASYLKSLIFCINLVIENRSRLPVAVSRAFLVMKNKSYPKDILEYEFSSHQLKVSSMIYSVSGKESEEIPQYSIVLPQTLQGLGAIGGYFYTKLPENFNEDELTEKYDFYIKLLTNRGGELIKTDLKSLLGNKVR